MNTISITDTTDYTRNTMDRLVRHLKKAEFNTEEYPFSKFEITEVQYLDGDSLRLQGLMSIKDVTKKITIPASVVHTVENSTHFYTELILDRYEWNIGKDASLLERNLVDREFKVRIELIAKELK